MENKIGISKKIEAAFIKMLLLKTKMYFIKPSMTNYTIKIEKEKEKGIK